ncbi:MAG: apolipoprotein N-acyltransferase [Acidobacteriota bacterium]
MRKSSIIVALSLASGLLFALPSLNDSLRFISFIAIIPWIILYDRYEKASIFAILIGVFLFSNIAYRTGFIYRMYIPPFISLFYIPYFIVFPIILKRVRKLNIPLCLSIPVVWVFFEWFRVHFSIGKFVFFLLGYNFAPDIRFIQIADIGGVYIVSFLVAAINGFLAELIIEGMKSRERRILKQEPAGAAALDRLFPWKKTILSALALVVLFSAALIYGFFRIRDKNWEEGPRIALLQPNIIHFIDNSTEVYLNQMLATEKGVMEDEVDLIVWPEYSIKGEVYKDPTIHNDLRWLSSRKNVQILLGGYGQAQKTKWKKTNSAFLISREGEVLSSYSKVLLFTWGEYIPLDGVLGKISRHAQVSVRRIARRATGVEPFIEPGDEISTMKLLYRGRECRFSTVICHETIFPGITREAKRNGADFIINITSEGLTREYFQRQILHISIMRAVENKISILRDGNTGITAFINPYGEVQSVLGKSGEYGKVQGILKDVVHIKRSRTFYSTSGDLFAYACIATLIVFLLLSIKKSSVPSERSSKRWLVILLFVIPAVLLISCPPLVCCQKGIQRDNDFVSHIEKAQEYLNAGDPNNAFKEFVKVTRMNPDASKAYPFIAQTFSTFELNEVGEEFFRKLKSRGADNPELHFYHGFFQEALADYGEAEKSYRRAIEQKNDYMVAYMKMSDMFINQGNAKKALAILQEYVSRFGENELVLKFLARAELLNRNFARGQEIAVKLLDINQSNAEYHLLLGLAAFYQRNYSEAERRFKEAESLAPDNSTITLYLGRVYLRTGNFSELEKQIEKAGLLARKVKR